MIYREVVIRRSSDYRYDVPDGAIVLEKVHGTEAIEMAPGRVGGARSFHALRVLVPVVDITAGPVVDGTTYSVGGGS